MELAIVLIFFVPMLLIGAGLEWMARQEPRGAVIKFLMGGWDDLELESDGDDAQLADPPVPRSVHGHERADPTSVTFPQGPVAGGALVADHAHDTAGHQTSHTYLGGHGQEAVSPEMFGGLLDGGAGNDTQSEGMALAANPGSNLFDTRSRPGSAGKALTAQTPPR